MLYGFKEYVDGSPATILVAANSVDEYDMVIDAILSQVEKQNWVKTYASTFIDAMRSELFKGYKKSVLAVYHKDEEQREAFIDEWNVEPLQSKAAQDRHLDMLFDKKEEIRISTQSEEDRNKTIEEMTGLDVYDPWDRRTEEEVEADKLMKEKMKEMKKSGEMSDDSFGSADELRSKKNTNAPGAYSRSQAINALKQFSDREDDEIDNLTNDELLNELTTLGVPNIKGVYDDDNVPQKEEDSENIESDLTVRKVSATKNDDGSWNIDSIQASKTSEIDEELKAEREKAHQELVEEKLNGKKTFSPEDFAAAMRGDGSADAVTNVTGDNRHKREATEKPVFSPEAEAARREYQEKMDQMEKDRRLQQKKENDVKARGERDRGIFKGADLYPEDMEDISVLPEEMREHLPDLKEIGVKDYPYNSMLGKKVIIPADNMMADKGVKIVGYDNMVYEGDISMMGSIAAIMSLEDETKDGMVIYIDTRSETPSFHAIRVRAK